jgi:hypothetical protein
MVNVEAQTLIPIIGPTHIRIGMMEYFIGASPFEAGQTEDMQYYAETTFMPVDRLAFGGGYITRGDNTAKESAAYGFLYMDDPFDVGTEFNVTYFAHGDKFVNAMGLDEYQALRPNAYNKWALIYYPIDIAASLRYGFIDEIGLLVGYWQVDDGDYKNMWQEYEVGFDLRPNEYWTFEFLYNNFTYGEAMGVLDGESKATAEVNGTLSF